MIKLWVFRPPPSLHDPQLINRCAGRPSWSFGVDFGCWVHHNTTWAKSSKYTSYLTSYYPHSSTQCCFGSNSNVVGARARQMSMSNSCAIRGRSVQALMPLAAMIRSFFWIWDKQEKQRVVLTQKPTNTLLFKRHHQKQPFAVSIVLWCLPHLWFMILFHPPAGATGSADSRDVRSLPAPPVRSADHSGHRPSWASHRCPACGHEVSQSPPWLKVEKRVVFLVEKWWVSEF